MRQELVNTSRFGRFAAFALLALVARVDAYDGDVEPSDEACSVTLLVDGMMKSRSGAT